MRFVCVPLLLLLLPLLGLPGCGGTGGGGRSASRGGDTTADGLRQVDIEGEGRLFLRENHGIGGYDAIAIAPSFVNYRRSSTRLDPDLENAYLAALEQSLIDVAESANVEIVNEIGDCVIKVGAGFVNVQLARSSSARVLGEMTLVVEYQDSTSGQSLLRYAAEERVEREADGTSREEQVEASFDRMIEDIDIISALRKATAVPSPPRPGCKGDLINAGRPSAAD